MRAQQMVRAMSTIASVACLDTGLRLAVRHLDQLRLVRSPGRPSGEDPTPAAILGACAVEMVLADVLTQAVARLIHHAPEAAGLGTAVAKELTPILARRALLGATDLLGARGVIAEGAGGVLARLRADNEVVRYIDLSVAANQRVVAMHLSTFGVARVAEISEDFAASKTAAPSLFSLLETLPELDLTQLALRPRPNDPVVVALANSCAAAVDALHAPDTAATEELADLVAWVWDAVRDELLSLAEQRVDSAGIGIPGEAVTRFSWLWAGACCVHLWLSNRDLPLFGGAPGWTGWLRDTLHYIRVEVGGNDSGNATKNYPATLRQVRGLIRTAQAVTALPHPLADAPTGTDED